MEVRLGRVDDGRCYGHVKEVQGGFIRYTGIQVFTFRVL